MLSLIRIIILPAGMLWNSLMFVFSLFFISYLSSSFSHKLKMTTYTWTKNCIHFSLFNSLNRVGKVHFAWKLVSLGFGSEFQNCAPFPETFPNSSFSFLLKKLHCKCLSVVACHRQRSNHPSNQTQNYCIYSIIRSAWVTKAS